MQTISDKEYSLLSSLVYDNIGIKLGTAKRELLRTRLAKRLRILGIPTFKEYYRYATDENREELRHLFDAISTNFTSFFRESQHFDFMVDNVLPGLVDEKRKEKRLSLRVWSAACSTGEEPYSIAITLCDHIDDAASWDIKILATDVNSVVLERAEEGVYKEERVKDIAKLMLKGHFLKSVHGRDGTVKAKRHLRDMIAFRRFNLTVPTYPFNKGFDFIFCRNVMIYFDKETQKRIVDNLYRHLRKGGYLFLGHAESLTGLDTPFQYIKPTIYRKSN